MIRHTKPFLALGFLSASVLVPAVTLAACSSDSTSTPAGPTPSGSVATVTPPTAATPTTSPTATSTSTADASAPDAGSCSAKAKSDLRLLAANTGTAPSNKVTAKMVDACDGTSAAQAFAGARLPFTPTVGKTHYFLVDSTNPADFYKSASVVFDYPSAGIRNDTDVKLFGKPGNGVADSFGANYDATKVHFYVQLNKVEAACDVSGYTVSVVGHPEAVVQYTNGGTFAPDGALTVSGGIQGSSAFISKVNPGAGFVEIVGTKPGCKLVGPVFPVAISTNTYPLIADTVTHVVANTSL